MLADGLLVQHADGTLENVPACGYPHYTPRRGEFSGWVESSSVTTSTSFGELTATWIVPPEPTSKHGQTVFFFPGFEGTGVSIFQPVLAWNDDFAGAWSIASWNCCPKGITWESSAVSVNAGDEIQGTIRSTCSAGTLSCSTWNVTSEDVSTGQSTTLSHTPSEGQTFNWAFAALEVYNVIQCSDYPSNGSLTFFDVTLYDNNFNQISNPGWSLPNSASGLPRCGYGGQVAATQVTLDYYYRALRHSQPRGRKDREVTDE